MKPLYINKKNNWHCQRVLLVSDFVTWTARYILDLLFVSVIQIISLLVICCYLFICHCHLLVHEKHKHKLWNQLEFSKNRSSVSYFFVYWKPVSLHVLVFLVEYELVNVDCIVISIKLLSTFVLLWICCIFSKHLFIRTPMERCFCIASHYHSHEAARRMSEKNLQLKGIVKLQAVWLHIYWKQLPYMYY